MHLLSVNNWNITITTIKIWWAFLTSLCELIQVKTFDFWAVLGVNKVHNISAANSWWPSHLIFVKKDSADILEIPLTLGFSFKSAFSLEPKKSIRDEGRVSNFLLYQFSPKLHITKHRAPVYVSEVKCLYYMRLYKYNNREEKQETKQI